MAQSKRHPSIIGASVSLSEHTAQSLRPTFWHPQAWRPRGQGVGDPPRIPDQQANIVALAEKGGDGVGADKAGPTGDEHRTAASLGGTKHAHRTGSSMGRRPAAKD